SGVGRALALRLAELGAQVFALSLIQAELDSLKAVNSAIETICVDLADWASTREAVKKVTPIHLLVNNAAAFRFASILEAVPEDIDISFDVNFKGGFNVSQVVASDLIARSEKGSIVNVSSIAGQKPVGAAAIYSASKAAVESISRSMALELSAKGVRVNAVCPNLVQDTNSGQMRLTRVNSFASIEEDRLLELRTPQGKYPCKNDIVNAIVFLLSDQSDLINGHSLPVDGGYLC
ncbi:NAD(P)-binding domain, partial [Trinorchestia longiramus]